MYYKIQSTLHCYKQAVVIRRVIYATVGFPAYRSLGVATCHAAHAGPVDG